MNPRTSIRLSATEEEQFLRDSKTIVLSTLDSRGYPHSVAMWCVMENGCCLMTTYAKSQKAVNIQRNPRVALLAESGTAYNTLKGVLIRGRAELIHDLDLCVHVLTRIHEKMSGALAEGVEQTLKTRARKRVVIKVTPERISSWDHSKLGGTY